MGYCVRKLLHLTSVKTWNQPAYILQVTALLWCVLTSGPLASAQTDENIRAMDPGVRARHVDSGAAFQNLNAGQRAFFDDGLQRFKITDSVSGTMPGEPNSGLGPRYNSTSCVSCHSQPAPGGSSPSIHAFPNIGPNPQIAAATHGGAINSLPYFIAPDGPVREARFKFFLSPAGQLSVNADGGVHALFTITGRPDATNTAGTKTCVLAQPDFELQRRLGNISFRIPTPVFGAGLLESISDRTILSNQNDDAVAKKALGISGMVNRNGNDGTITRFGWKAQNKSLQIFAGEAYNVEMGVTNELFQNERGNPGEVLPNKCLLNSIPEDTTNFSAISPPTSIPSDTVQFSTFMRFLDQPTPSMTEPGGALSIASGRGIFINQAKCVLCHTESLAVSAFTLSSTRTRADLYSDLLVHRMGDNLADGISQGAAGPDQFRTAPLWGVGQRIFFLHDGRTSDIAEAIAAHASPGSEANASIALYNKLSGRQRQDLLNFLRSL
jgi:CxxC motif-containing protein (DUF1111 family)